MERGAKDPDRDMKVTEVAALMVQHGWMLYDACELVCIDAGDVEGRVQRRIRRNRELPCTPTPEMIKARCEQIRATSPRPMIGFAIPSCARVREYSIVLNGSQIQENDT
jgi:hypothetical protein